jgi:hypothetical protein
MLPALEMLKVTSPADTLLEESSIVHSDSVADTGDEALP